MWYVVKFKDESTEIIPETWLTVTDVDKNEHEVYWPPSVISNNDHLMVQLISKEAEPQRQDWQKVSAVLLSPDPIGNF